MPSSSTAAPTTHCLPSPIDSLAYEEKPAGMTVSVAAPLALAAGAAGPAVVAPAAVGATGAASPCEDESQATSASDAMHTTIRDMRWCLFIGTIHHGSESRPSIINNQTT